MKNGQLWFTAVVILALSSATLCAQEAGSEVEMEAKEEAAEMQKSQPASPPATRTTSPRRRMQMPELDFVLNVLPASILVDADSDKFGITATDGSRIELSNVYIMPNLAAGVGMELGNFYLDVTGGAGLIVNDTFRSFLLDASLALSYAFTDSFKCGPRLGVIYFVDPEWLDDQDIAFDESWGFLAGLQLALGDRIMYFVSVDLLFASFDADSDETIWTVDENEAELTGLAAQFGVRGEF